MKNAGFEDEIKAIELSRCASPEIQRNAERYLIEMWHSRPFDFFSLIIYIVKRGEREFSLQTRKYSFILLAKALKPENQQFLDKIRRLWLDTENRPMVHEVGQMILDNLYSCDESIRNSCSLLIALMFGIDHPTWNIIIQDSSKEISEGTPLEFKIGFIKIFDEILCLPYFAKELSGSEFHPLYNRFLEMAISELASPSKGDAILRIAACSSVLHAVEAIPSIITPSDSLISAISQSLLIPNEQLFSLIHQTLLSLLRAFYTESEPFFPMILSTVLRSIGNEDYGFLISGLNFLRDFGLFEREVTKSRPFESKRYINSCLGSLFPILVRHLFVTNEDIISNTVLAMEALFQAAPVAFISMAHEYVDSFLKTEEYKTYNAAMLILSSVVESPEIGSREISEFIKYCLQVSYSIALLPDNGLKETSLFVLSHTILNFPSIFRDNDDLIGTVGKLIDIMSPSENEGVLERYSELIFAVSSSLPSDLVDHPFNQLYTAFTQSIHELFKAALKFQYKNLLSESFNAFCRFIWSCPSAALPELQYEWKEAISRLQSSFNSITDSDVQFAIQSGDCELLSSIAQRLGTIPSEDGLAAITTIFSILEQGNTLAFEEATYSLTYIASSIQPQPMPTEVVDRIFGYFSRIFEWGNLSAIPTAARTVAYMFVTLRNQVSMYAEGVLLTFFKYLDGMDINMKDIFPSLIYATAEIFEARGKNDPFIEQNIEKLQSILKEYMECPIDQNDEELSNSLLRSIAYGLRVILSFEPAFHTDASTKRKTMTEISYLSGRINALPNIAEDTLKEMLNLFAQASQTCSRELSALLNHRNNRKLIGCALRVGTLEQAAQDVKNRMESR